MRGILLLLGLVTLIAGLTPVAAGMATDELPPVSLAFVRFGLAGALLAVTARWLGLRFEFPRAAWPWLAALGVLCVPINQIGFLVGIRLSTASHAGIIYALVPMLVYWFALILRRTRFGVRMLAATTLAFVGAAVVVMTTTGQTRGPGQGLTELLIGDGLLLSAAVSWAVFTVLSQPLVRRHGAIQTLTVVFLLGAVFHAPLVVADYWWWDLASFEISRVTWRGLAGFGFITLITAYTNYLLWYLIISRSDVTRSSVVINSSFLITVLVESLWFGLELSWWVALGSSLLLAGVVTANYAKK